MKVYFKKQNYPSDINTPWLISAVAFKSGVYNPQALNSEEFMSVLNCLKEKFTTIDIRDIVLTEELAHAVFVRFTFKTQEDEDFFMLWASNGVNI